MTKSQSQSQFKSHSTRAITVYLGNFFDTLDEFVSDEWSTQTGKIAPLATKQESGSAAAATCLQTVLFQI